MKNSRNTLTNEMYVRVIFKNTFNTRYAFLFIENVMQGF